MSVTDKRIHRDALAGRQFYRPQIKDGVITPVTLSVNGTSEQFDVSAFLYALGGSIYYHAASTGHTLSAIHATGIGKWLGVLVQIDRTGTISTKGNPDTGDQDFASEAAALASLVGITDIGKLAIGTITLETNAADWDGNTDAFDEADLVSSNLLGYTGNRCVGRVKVGATFEVVHLRAMASLVSGTGYLECLTPPNGYTGILTHPHLEVDTRTVAGTTITMRHGGFFYAIDGIVYYKAAAYGVAFTAAHVVALNQWGAILFQINAAGTVSTKVGEATATTPLDYDNDAEARAALPDPDDGNAAIGVLVVEADAGTWTANTDDLLATGDLEARDVLPVLLDRLLATPGLAIDGTTAEKFHVDGFTFVVDGVKYTKTAANALTFTSNHVCTAEKYLAILVEIGTDGTVYTKVPLVDGRSQTAAQGFDSEAEAIAALPPVTPGRVACGYIVILADSGNWTANTDDLTDASDLTTAKFISYQAAENVVFAAQQAGFGQNVFTDATLATKRAQRRGYDHALILMGGTSGVAEEADLELAYRPYPMAGDAA